MTTHTPKAFAPRTQAPVAPPHAWREIAGAYLASQAALTKIWDEIADILPVPSALAAEAKALQETYERARDLLFGTPAPNGAALAVKLAAFADIIGDSRPDNQSQARATLAGGTEAGKALLALYLDARNLALPAEPVARPVSEDSGLAALWAKAQALAAEIDGGSAAEGVADRLFRMEDEIADAPCAGLNDARIKLALLASWLPRGTRSDGREMELVAQVGAALSRHDVQADSQCEVGSADWQGYRNALIETAEAREAAIGAEDEASVEGQTPDEGSRLRAATAAAEEAFDASLSAAMAYQPQSPAELAQYVVTLGPHLASMDTAFGFIAAKAARLQGYQPDNQELSGAGRADWILATSAYERAALAEVRTSLAHDAINDAITAQAPRELVPFLSYRDLDDAKGEADASSREALRPAFDAWNAKREALEAEHDLVGLSDAWEGADDAKQWAMRRVLATPAPDLEALAFKQLVLSRWNDEGELQGYDRPNYPGIGAEPGELALRIIYEDTLRLAGLPVPSRLDDATPFDPADWLQRFADAGGWLIWAPGPGVQPQPMAMGYYQREDIDGRGPDEGQCMFGELKAHPAAHAAVVALVQRRVAEGDTSLSAPRQR